MTETYRTFIAFDLNNDTKKQLHQIQKRFYPLELIAKWVAPENMHLTLKFIGNTSSEQIEKIKEILNNLRTSLRSQMLTINSLGAFPSIKRPKIFFADIQDTEKHIAAAANLIEQKLEDELGIPKENRAFKSHVTLARLKSPENIDSFAAKIKIFSFAKIKIGFDNITYFKSTLTPQGPIYNVLEKIILS